MKNAMRDVTSLTPAVSYDECIASWASPQSQVRSDIFWLDRFPSVDPPGRSLLLKKIWYGILFFSRSDFVKAPLSPFVVYF